METKSPIIHWYRKKNLQRDLLCLAAVLHKWDPLQEPGSMDETLLTEAEFDDCMAKAKALYQSACEEAKGKKKRARVLANEKQLIAVIVTKPSLTELDALSAMADDDSMTAKHYKESIRGLFTSNCVWPKQATQEMAWIMEESPASFGSLFPAAMMGLAGGDGDSVKKVG